MSDDWRSALVGSEETVEQVAHTLTDTSLRIVLVIDENRRLLGTVTDGDIRRGLMSGIDMKSTVGSIMQTKPAVISPATTRQEASRIMRERDLFQLPVVDEEGVVVGLESVHDVLGSASRENPVLLMAGGFGRRLHPLTQDLPKPLLPVGGKPIIETLVGQLCESGFVDIFMSVHYRGSQIREHFGDGSNWGVKIRYLDEEVPLGTAGALGLLDPSEVKSPVLMMNSDLLTNLDFCELVDYHESQDSLVTICVREHELTIPFGVVECNSNKVTKITEKPTERFFVNAGIYVVEPRTLELCSPNCFLDMPDLLTTVIDNGEAVTIFPIHEFWQDIGRIDQYQQAVSENSKVGERSPSND